MMQFKEYENRNTGKVLLYMEKWEEMGEEPIGGRHLEKIFF